MSLKLIVNALKQPIWRKVGLLDSKSSAVHLKRLKSSLTPITPFIGEKSMFSIEVIKQNQDTIPLLAITGGGVVFGFLWILRNTLTRNDIRWRPKNGKMGFEKTDHIEKGDVARKQKLLVFKQKYDYPDELVEALNALREPTEEEKKQKEEEEAKQAAEAAKKKK